MVYQKTEEVLFTLPGAIDGYSTKILWLKNMRRGNWPDMIESFYIQTVGRLGDCSMKIITDVGTENRMTALTKCFFSNK